MKKILVAIIYNAKNFLLYNRRRKISVKKGVIVRKNAGIKVYNGEIIIQTGTVLEKYTSLSALEGGKLVIGNNVYFNENCKVVARGEIQIGSNTLIGPGVYMYDHNHKFDENGVEPNRFRKGEIIIEENCWIGAGAIILKGTHIGKNSIISAGTVVKSNIPANSIVYNDNRLKIEHIKINDQMVEME